MINAMKDARSALGFLTRIPVGRIEPYDPTLRRAAGYFPLVGVVVGTVGVAAWWGASALLGEEAAAVAAVLATVVVTGAFHEDGLADAADGLWGGATRERRLEIMRDSRLGTYGTIALVGDLLLRAAILVPFGDDAVWDVARILIAGHVIGRAAPLALVNVLPYTQREDDGGRVRPQLSAPSRAGAILAGVTVLAAAVAAAGIWTWVPLGVAGLTVVAVRRLAKRRIGGVTGDVLGAGTALTITTVTAATAALIHGGYL